MPDIQSEGWLLIWTKIVRSHFWPGDLPLKSRRPRSRVVKWSFALPLYIENLLENKIPWLQFSQRAWHCSKHLNRLRWGTLGSAWQLKHLSCGNKSSRRSSISIEAFRFLLAGGRFDPANYDKVFRSGNVWQICLLIIFIILLHLIFLYISQTFLNLNEFYQIGNKLPIGNSS